MEFEEKNFPINKIDGIIENGKQFDIDIVLPEDNRNVIFGIVKDSYGDPVAGESPDDEYRHCCRYDYWRNARTQ